METNMPEREISMAGEGKNSSCGERKTWSLRGGGSDKIRTVLKHWKQRNTRSSGWLVKDFADFARFGSGSEELWLLNHPEFRTKPH